MTENLPADNYYRKAIIDNDGRLKDSVFKDSFYRLCLLHPVKYKCKKKKKKKQDPRDILKIHDQNEFKKKKKS